MEDINTPIKGKGKVSGFILAIVIIIIAIAAGYFVFMRSSDTYPNKDDVAGMLRMQSSSDDISSIEADLKATNIDAIN
jgi:hypothetical protein